MQETFLLELQQINHISLSGLHSEIFCVKQYQMHQSFSYKHVILESILLIKLK